MKRILIFLLLVLCYLFFATRVFAQDEFSTSVTAEYFVYQNGRTHVSHTINLVNKFSTIHAISYSFSIQGVTPQNIKVSEGGLEIPSQVETSGNQTKIMITFPTAVVGRDKSRTFVIEYEDDKTATRNGQVWELTIPKLQDFSQYQSYTTKLTLPKSFGSPAYLSPKPLSQSESPESITYFYDGSQMSQAGVVAAFGRFQIFNFTLSYHLKNPYKSDGQTQIALPPDTAFQRVYYGSIIPKPTEVKIDEDGNWLATYFIKGGDQFDVEARGSAQLFAQAQDFYPKNFKEGSNLGSSEFWQADDPKIYQLARELGTPKAIYDYVTRTLKYDYNRVRQNVTRLGAKQALDGPNSAICMEFTDLFVALARAAGIPAREINGFAYTDNPEIQPLSLVADVLHAWPEYWDSERGVWVPVDPTWGKTTGGVDYFSKFDLSHISFAIHGKSPIDPLPAGSYKLPGNPQKDVMVYFGNLPEKREPNLSIIPSVSPKIFPFLDYKGKLRIKNDGPVAVYNFEVLAKSFDGVIILSNNKIQNLLPYSQVEIPFSWKTSISNQLPSASIIAGGNHVLYTIPREYIFWQILGSFSILVVVGTIFLSPLFVGKRLKEEKTINDDPKQKVTKTSRFPWRLPFQKR